MRLGRLYDTGFNINSHRQFCSRFVHEVLKEACGESLGEISTLAALLARHPDTDLRFWKLWYFGKIPWWRQTITPASLYLDPALQVAFDGRLSARAGVDAHPGIASRGRVPPPSLNDSLSLPPDQDTRTNEGGAEWPSS